VADRLPRITAAQALRALQRDRWGIVRQTGSHAVLRHPERAGRVVLPRHARVILKPGILSNVIKDAGLTVEEFRALI
jgi:predicted RNA binding protein YcfA (HicA-like mRNA interferase family)